MNTWWKDPLLEHDPDDPNPWHAVLVDNSIPINPEAKAAWLKDNHSFSRQYLLPAIRPFARLSIIFVQALKYLLPKKWRASKLLHHLIYLGLRYFVSPEANFMVMRHFHLGSEIQQFILKNLPDVDIPELHFMRFKNLRDLKEHAFLRHDLNLFNFIIWLNQELVKKGQVIKPPKQLDLSMISDGPLPLDELPKGALNKIDLLTAIEIYTPVFQLFLTDSDFWRASNSLQLDETIAIYASQILHDPLPLLLVNNRHPMVAQSTMRAAYRLVLHGLATEMLHGHLVKLKKNNFKTS